MSLFRIWTVILSASISSATISHKNWPEINFRKRLCSFQNFNSVMDMSCFGSCFMWKCRYQFSSMLDGCSSTQCFSSITIIQWVNRTFNCTHPECVVVHPLSINRLLFFHTSQSGFKIHKQRHVRACAVFALYRTLLWFWHDRNESETGFDQ